MKKLSLKELFIGYENVSFPYGVDINIVTEAMPYRTDAPGGALLFFTEKVGKVADGVAVLEPQSAPIAIVVSETQAVESAYPIIRVKSVRIALAYALANQNGLDSGKIKFIGVTGTNGKTTTATLIYEILLRCGYKVGFIGTGKIISNGYALNDDYYSMTTPDPTLLYPSIARMSENGCEYIVMEVSSHSIALGKIAPIKFEYSIFTNLDNDHLDFHATKEEYYKTKLRLFSDSRIGLFNLDDEYSKRAYEESKCEKRSFGIIEGGDTFATEIRLSSLKKTSFFYRSKDLIFKAETRLCGAFNVYNVLAALRCVIDLGIKPCIAKRALSEIDGIGGRMEMIDGAVSAVIDYAHTPAAFLNCLKTIKSAINNEQNIIVVFGCGGDRDKSKRSFFGKYAELYADKIVITEDNSRTEDFDEIVKDIALGIENKEYSVINDRADAIRYAFKIAQNGDVVAVIGKGHERYKIVGKEYLPFDEKGIIRDAMQERGLL